MAINLGLALDDMAVAPQIYQRAVERGIGSLAGALIAVQTAVSILNSQKHEMAVCRAVRIFLLYQPELKEPPSFSNGMAAAACHSSRYLSVR